MTNTPDAREILLLHGRGHEDVTRLADALTRKLVAELFNVDGRIHRLVDGHLTPINNDSLRTLIGEQFTTGLRLVCRDSRYETEYFSHDLSRQTLTDVTAALLLLVAKGPTKARALSPQQEMEVRDRSRSGEHLDVIARSYGISRADVDALAARRW